MKKILIAGGCGFIGSALSNLLHQRGYDVSVVDTQGKPKHLNCHHYIKGDVTNRSLMNDVVPEHDVIFNYAGLLGTHELIENNQAYDAVKINVLGTINVLDAARLNNTKVFQVTKPQFWQNTYTITKIASENFAIMYFKEFKLPITLLRYYNIFGPYQRTDIYQKAVPTFIIKALHGEPMPIFGKGQQTTDHMYVEDAVNATLGVMDSNKFIGEVVDIGSGSEISVLEIAKHVCQLTQCKYKVKHLPMRVGEDEHTEICANLSQLNSIGFKQKFTFEKGLEKTIQHYRSIKL